MKILQGSLPRIFRDIENLLRISVISIEEQHYYEYNNALPDAVLIGVVEVNP
jgi:flagellar motor switch protein FliM